MPAAPVMPQNAQTGQNAENAHPNVFGLMTRVTVHGLFAALVRRLTGSSGSNPSHTQIVVCRGHTVCLKYIRAGNYRKIVAWRMSNENLGDYLGELLCELATGTTKTAADVLRILEQKLADQVPECVAAEIIAK